RPGLPRRGLTPTPGLPRVSPSASEALEDSVHNRPGRWLLLFRSRGVPGFHGRGIMIRQQRKNMRKLPSRKWGESGHSGSTCHVHRWCVSKKDLEGPLGGETMHVGTEASGS